MNDCLILPLAELTVNVSPTVVPVGADIELAVTVAFVNVHEAFSNVSDCRIKFVAADSISKPLNASVIGLYWIRKTFTAAVCRSPLDPKKDPVDALVNEPVAATVFGLITFIQPSYKLVGLWLI